MTRAHVRQSFINSAEHGDQLFHAQHAENSADHLGRTDYRDAPLLGRYPTMSVKQNVNPCGINIAEVREIENDSATQAHRHINIRTECGPVRKVEFSAQNEAHRVVHLVRDAMVNIPRHACRPQRVPATRVDEISLRMWSCEFLLSLAKSYVPDGPEWLGPS